MANYALIKDGFVVNTVVWNGVGDIFSDYVALEITVEESAQIGDAYINEKLHPKPRDGYDYDFNVDKLEWIITADSAKEQAADLALEQLQTAQGGTSGLQKKLTLFRTRSRMKITQTPILKSQLKRTKPNGQHTEKL